MNAETSTPTTVPALTEHEHDAAASSTAWSSRRSSLISSRSFAAYSKRSSSAAANISSSSVTTSFSSSLRSIPSTFFAPRRRRERGNVRRLEREELGDVADALQDRLRRDAVLLVVGELDRAPAVRLVERLLDRLGLLVGVHEHLAVDVARGAADRLDERGRPRRKPSLSASRIATSDTSGRSRPSRRRFTPTSTSYSPSRSSRTIWMRSSVSISEWR